MKNVGILLLALLIVSCGKGKMEIQTQTTFNGAPLEMNEYYTLDNGTQLSFSIATVFFSNITVQSQDENFLISDVEKFKNGERTTFSDKIKATSVSGLQLGVGVSSDLNAVSPVDQPEDSPLYYYESELDYWSWAMGYKFINFTGLYKDSIDDPAPKNFIYHVGLDDNYLITEVDVPFSKVNKKNEQTLSLNIDVKKIFDNPINPIDVRIENYTQSELTYQEVTDKVVNNLADAIIVE